MATPMRIRPLRWWDLFVVLLLAVAGVLGVAEALDEHPLWAASAPEALRLTLIAVPLVAFAALYIVLGRRALGRGLENSPTDAAGKTFLVLLLVVLFVAAATVPMYAVMQTLVYPMIWVIAVSYRVAVAWSGAAALTTGVAMLWAIAPSDLGSAFASGGLTAALSFIFAVAMGTWITKIAEQGERYRALAEQLRLSQAEVAGLSKDAGAAAERERLSRELHDTLTQTLAGLVMLSEQAERALDDGDAGRARERLERVNSAAREAVAEARALVATTQPLGEGGLAAAIERVARRLADDTGMHVACAVEPVALDREREVVLLRAAQEGMANARKHARAAHVRVTLRQAAEGPVLRVEDDGVGPDAAAMERGGFGLSGLADRVRAVGGEVTFGPGAAGGSVLEVRVDAGEAGQ